MRLTNLEENWTTIARRPVFFRESRATFPPESRTLIHIHGMGMSGTYMVPTADRLAGDYRSYVPDLPGFGRSSRNGVPPSIEGMAQSTIDFMDALEIDKATLIGNSMGCMTIMEVAHRCPERLEAAILCSPGYPVYEPLARGIWQMLQLPVREPLGMIPIVIHDYLRCGLPDVLRLYRSMVSYPTSARFRRMATPTLIVQGEKDPLLLAKRVDPEAARQGRFQVVTIPGAAHALNFSHPEETATAISNFLQERAALKDENCSQPQTGPH